MQLMLYIFDCLEYFANEVILKVFQREVKKRKNKTKTKRIFEIT